MELRLNDNNYWNFINEINWYQISKCKDSKQATNEVKEFCAKNYDFDTLVELNNFTWDRKNFLKNQIYSFYKSLPSELKNTKYKEFFSDDFIDDTASHVVGLGKTFYEYICDNIGEIASIKNDVVENFRYGICMAQEEVVLFS